MYTEWDFDPYESESDDLPTGIYPEDIFDQPTRIIHEDVVDPELADFIAENIHQVIDIDNLAKLYTRDIPGLKYTFTRSISKALQAPVVREAFRKFVITALSKAESHALAKNPLIKPAPADPCPVCRDNEVGCGNCAPCNDPGGYTRGCDVGICQECYTMDDREEDYDNDSDDLPRLRYW